MTRLHLSPLALGLAAGVLWGVSILIIGLLAFFIGYGELFVTTMGTLYMGYDTTIIGSLIGGIIGFVYGFITGFLLAWLYNIFVR